MTALPPNPPSPPGVELAPGVFVPESVLRFTFSRSSGPGGQNVNKLATKARLNVALRELEARIGPAAARRLEAMAGASHLTEAGDLVLTSQESRSQQANRQSCLERLRALLVGALRPPKPRRRTRPTASSRRARLQQKQHRSRTKQRRGTHSNDD